MPRKKQNIVDYFPHNCNHGKTMFILEQKYGNDGYAFWFKLLEFIGKSHDHFIDCNDNSTWVYLQAVAKTDETTTENILNMLAELDAIDSELWENRVIWSANFIENVDPVYKNRRSDTPEKPCFHKNQNTTNSKNGTITTSRNDSTSGKLQTSYSRNDSTSGILQVEIPQSRVEDSTVDKTIVNTNKKGRENYEEYKQIFEKFRKLYRGTKNGLEKEFKNFQKHKDWELAIHNLCEAVGREIEHKKQLRDNKGFDKRWKHLTTWINQRCWEDEHEQLDKSTRNSADFSGLTESLVGGRPISEFIKNGRPETLPPSELGESLQPDADENDDEQLF